MLYECKIRVLILFDFLKKKKKIHVTLCCRGGGHNIVMPYISFVMHTSAVSVPSCSHLSCAFPPRAKSIAGRWAGLSRRSPEEIKSREVVLGLRVGLLLLQLFPNGGAIDVVFVTLFCIAVGTAIAWCWGRCATPDRHCLNILLFWRRSTAASVFRVGACFEVSLFCPPFPTRPRP